MAGATLHLHETFKMPGKVRAFLNWLFDILRLKKRGKAAQARRPARAKAKSGETDAAADADADAAAWPPERLNVIEKLWGEGCTSPSSAEFLRVSVPMLSLSEKKSLLLLGAGLGGVGRAMVNETGVWVTGYEADEELAALGKNQTKMTGMQKRAPVTWANMEDVKLKENSFNTVISLESLYRVTAKEQLYAAMIAALRVDGELLMTDFVSAGDGPPGKAVENWLAAEPTPPHLWKAEAIQSFLKTQNMDVRPCEDITGRYRAGIFNGFFRYLSTVTKPELIEISGDLIKECEYWAGQLSAIDSGGLKVFKFHAFKLPEKRKSKF